MTAHDIVYAVLCSIGHASDTMHELFEEAESEKDYRDKLLAHVAGCDEIEPNIHGSIAYCILHDVIAELQPDKIHYDLFGRHWEKA